MLGTFLNREKKIIKNQWEWVIFGAESILNMETMEIEIKHYLLKNILIKSDHT